MKNLIQKTIDQTMNSGADACDIIVNSGESLNLSAQDGKIDKFKLAKTSVLGIRVIKDKKVGLAYSESFDQDAIQFAVKSALENAQFSDINEFENIHVKNSSDLISVKSSLVDSSSLEEKIEFTLKLESEVKRKDSRAGAVPYNGLSVSESTFYYMNSLGTYAAEEKNLLSAYTSALLKSGSATSTHSIGILDKTLALLNLDQCVDECLEHAANWLEAKPVATGKYDVIFDTDTLSEILGAFSSCFSAKEAIDKTNPWAQKIGQSVAAADFTLIDSPFYKDALVNYRVDCEGMLRSDLSLIENGTLKSFYHNTATAKHFGIKSTGHAYRDAKSALDITSTNWLIKPGKNSAAEVSDGTYLEIIDLMGLHSGSDSVSGEFSFGASGYLCKDGKRIQPVKGITVAGNFNNLLSGITRMGNQLKCNSSRSMFSPMIRFSGLSVAGN